MDACLWGCRNLKTTCEGCGRTVCTKTLPIKSPPNINFSDASNEMVWGFNGFKSIPDMILLIQYLQTQGFNYFYSPSDIDLYFTKKEEIASKLPTSQD